MLQNATPLRKSAPWPPNISDEHVSCTAPATENASLQNPLQMSHACHRFWKCYKTLTFCSLLTKCTIPCACHAKRDLNVQKWSCVLYILTSKRASRHNRRALFRHLNFQKWSEREVFLAFSLTNVLRTTMACICSSLIWPDGSAPAALASLLFDPPSASAHLCFSSVHIVGSLTSKLPSFVYFSAGTKAVMSKSRRFRSFAISIYMVLEHVKQWLLIWTSISIHLHRIKNRGTAWSAVCCPLFVFKVRKEFPQNILVFGLLRAFCFFRFCSSLLIFKIKVIFTMVSFKARLDHPK